VTALDAGALAAGPSVAVGSPHLDEEAVEQVGRRCDKLGTTLTISGSEPIGWRKP
jgi:hypothetical protein